ncbi:hypothetical protein WJX74_002844 [Apatococcus lobatus]|uniref:Lysosomal Pro-X carboxypeptidase n=1 Tax=Apatococcus lobatus TaxID=904363 RepID=A0AAW1S4W5_9CHLO
MGCLSGWIALAVLASSVASQRVRPHLDSFKGAAPDKSYLESLASNSDHLVDHCDERWRNTTLDHYSWEHTPQRHTYLQRYFVCGEHWTQSEDGTPGPIFLYLGNEADVTLYLNNSGLMWESAPDFGALLVFAEHRYYGKSKPFKENLRQHMEYLTADQAMADYAELMTELRAEFHAEDSAVIGFGGSYGGMLAVWMRMKFPHILDGIVAGSAPIWTFYGEDPPWDSGSYAKVVTRDATPAAGAAEACAPNMRQAWQELFSASETAEGRRRVRDSMQLCPDAHLDNRSSADALAGWLSSAFDYLAMGEYPYPSPYILNGAGILPAFPMRTACSHLADPHLDGPGLLQGLARAAGVFYNYSGQLECMNWAVGPNPETQEDGDFWGYQSCTEQFMPMSRDGVHDMYWPQPFNKEEAFADCQRQWNVTPRPMWPTINWGGRHIRTITNAVFSNGLLDPWHPGGVLQDLNPTAVAVIIPEGAHHLDLMFSHPDDPESVKHARNIERQHIARWIRQKQLSPSHMATPGADVVF